VAWGERIDTPHVTRWPLGPDDRSDTELAQARTCSDTQIDRRCSVGRRRHRARLEGLDDRDDLRTDLVAAWPYRGPQRDLKVLRTFAEADQRRYQCARHIRPEAAPARVGGADRRPPCDEDREAVGREDHQRSPNHPRHQDIDIAHLGPAGGALAYDCYCCAVDLPHQMPRCRIGPRTRTYDITGLRQSFRHMRTVMRQVGVLGTAEPPAREPCPDIRAECDVVHSVVNGVDQRRNRGTSRSSSRSSSPSVGSTITRGAGRKISSSSSCSVPF
jgi:hypothetical protein